MNNPSCKIDKEEQEIDAKMHQNIEEMERLATETRELSKKKQGLQEQSKQPIFDAIKRTVQWGNKTLKLSKVRFQILTTLYFASNREMTVTDLETAVWEETSLSNIKSTVSRLGTILTNAGFPFFIESVKSESRFMEVDDRKGSRTVKARSALAGYKLA